ncbi:Gfo/Idh/MocA family protein [Parvularcula marina]|uniref:Gfo/Idh/MocA family protein n=1 Tax=Parvularcula marina TaxID=2292771 RepID=UPI003512BDEF
MSNFNRRDAVKGGAALGAAAAFGIRPSGATPPHRLDFGVIGLNHGHIYSQCAAVIRGGGRLTHFYAVEDDLAAEFQNRFPEAKRVSDEREIIEHETIRLVVSAAIPAQRAPIGIRVMKAGKDYMADKPGITSLEQLAEVRRVQKETGSIYSISYSERFENYGTIRASELVAKGAIGDVIQTIGLGPHRIRPATRPDWFWDPAQFGGIICDIGSHQMDQFLHFTGSTEAEVVASQTGNFHNEVHPDFQDFGDAMLRGNGGVGYVRIDWFTPEGLGYWGDGRLMVLGTDGYIDLRKYVDIGGAPGRDHLFLVDQKEIRQIDCSDVVPPYGPQLVDDVLNRTETAMSQAHCFLATELALKAQAQASRADTFTPPKMPG